MDRLYHRGAQTHRAALHALAHFACAECEHNAEFRSRTPCTPDKCNFEKLVHTTPMSAINISTSIKHNGTCDVKALLEWRQDPLLDKCQVLECIYDQTAPGVFHTHALISDISNRVEKLSDQPEIQFIDRGIFSPYAIQ